MGNRLREPLARLPRCAPARSRKFEPRQYWHVRRFFEKICYARPGFCAGAYFFAKICKKTIDSLIMAWYITGVPTVLTALVQLKLLVHPARGSHSVVCDSVFDRCDSVRAYRCVRMDCVDALVIVCNMVLLEELWFHTR